MMANDGRSDVGNIEFRIVDPLKFYSLRKIDGIDCLYCQVKVTIGMMLGGFEISMRNINPKLGGFMFTSSTKKLIKVPHVGLPGPKGSRGDLYVEQIIEAKPLEEEIYPVLLKLQEKINQTLSKRSYNQNIK
jgi:hypothetical protein